VERLEEPLVGDIPFFEGLLRDLLAVLAEPRPLFTLRHLLLPVPSTWDQQRSGHRSAAPTSRGCWRRHPVRHIRYRKRSKHGKPEPKSRGYNCVDLVRVANPSSTQRRHSAKRASCKRLARKPGLLCTSTGTLCQVLRTSKTRAITSRRVLARARPRHQGSTRRIEEMHAEKGAWVGHAPGQPFYGERGRVRCNDVGLGGRNGSQHIALYRPILRHCLYHQVDAVTGTVMLLPW